MKDFELDFLDFLMAHASAARQTDATKPLGNVPVTGDPVYHEGHVCPNPECRDVQTMCREGMPFTHHSHVCPSCGTKWQHGPGR